MQESNMQYAKIEVIIMAEMYAFWKYDVPPYLLGGKIADIMENGTVSIEGYAGYKFKPVAIVPLEEGLKLQMKLDAAEIKYNETIKKAKDDLDEVVKEISQKGISKKK